MNTTNVRIALFCSLMLAAAGCGASPEDARHDSATGSIGSAADAPGLAADTVGHGNAGASIANPDQRFLRWMLNHHAEVVYLAHQATRHPDSATIRALAQRVDRSHDAETARMRTLLRAEFGDTTSPAIRREHAAMVTPFASMRGEAYGSAFRSFLVAHHSEAVKMLDSASSGLQRPAVRNLAEEIRRARTGDIDALRRAPGGQE